MSTEPQVPGGTSHIDPKLVVCGASLVCYLVYKRYEPASPAANAVLLLLIPGVIAKAVGGRIIGFTASYWLLIILYTILYRLSPFHPLAKYPGPLLARVSKFYTMYYSIIGETHRKIRSLHEQYGEVVRIGPNELSFNRAEAIPYIYNLKVAVKGPIYDLRSHFDGTTQLDGVRDYQVHAARRRPWTKAMSPVSIQGFLPILADKTHHLVDELSKHQGQTIDMSHWITLFGLDVMGQLVFGKDFGTLSAGHDCTGFMKMIVDGLTAGTVITHIPWLYHILKWLPNPQFEEMQLRSENLARERTQMGSRTRDLYYFLTEDEIASQSGATEKEIIADGMLSLVAGSDTSAVTITHLIYYLLRHPECAERLKKEIDETFPDGDDPLDFSRQADMPYLNACLNETLRLLPPILGGSQRRFDRGTGGSMIGNHYVPEETQVCVHLYSLQRNPLEFSPLPDTFWPDRWLTQDKYTLPTGDIIDKEQLVHNRSAFIPFSTGQQNCAGKGLAMVELRGAACALLHRFDFRPDPAYDLDDWEKQIKDIFITHRGSLPLIILPRSKA